MSLMGILRELYEIDDLKMNIKFEIEVLCKHLGLKIDEVTPQRVLCNRLQPRRDKTPDFNVRPSAAAPAQQPASPDPLTPPPTASSAPLAPGSAGGTDAATTLAAGGGGAVEQTVIPNLGAYVTVNSMLALFQQHPTLKAMVPVAVDRAIREIIQPAVERSVTIACITTKELVIKDFAMEGNEQKMHKGAQLMVANLAGSLAVVTCKEPANNLRPLLQSVPGLALGPAALEQAAQTCSADNLELGCILIEKAATEAAIRDIDEALAVPLAERRKAAAQGQAYMDEALAGKRYPAALPEILRPTRAGLGPAQMLVYEAFARQPRQPIAPPQPSSGGGVSEVPASMDAPTAMAVYGRLVTALEASMARS